MEEKGEILQISIEAVTLEDNKYWHLQDCGLPEVSRPDTLPRPLKC